jgi:hypothetical protein
MTTLNIVRIAAAIGTIHPDELSNLLADSRYTQAEVAAIAGTTPSRLAALLAEPVLYRQPINWTPTATVGDVEGYPPHRAAQVYAGPGIPGFTWGAPVYVSDARTAVLSNDTPAR